MTKLIAEQVAGYTYGTDAVARSPISLPELETLKVSVGFTGEDLRYLLLAGDVLKGQANASVLHWRSGIIANIPKPGATLAVSRWKTTARLPCQE